MTLSLLLLRDHAIEARNRRFTSNHRQLFGEDVQGKPRGRYSAVRNKSTGRNRRTTSSNIRQDRTRHPIGSYYFAVEICHRGALPRFALATENFANRQNIKDAVVLGWGRQISENSGIAITAVIVIACQ